MAGCSATEEAGGGPESAAGSLTLDIIVLTEEAADEAAEVLDQSARFIVLADGSLHARAPAAVGSMDLPPRVRRLREAEIDDLRVLSAAAIGTANEYEAPIDLGSLTPPREATLVAITRSLGDQRVMRRTWHDGLESDEAAVALVERLAEYAWAGVRPADAIDPGPVRYDLGPDPYARYRRGE